MEWTCDKCNKEWIDDCSDIRDAGNCDCIEYTIRTPFTELILNSTSSYKAALITVGYFDVDEPYDIEVHSAHQTTSFNVGLTEDGYFAERL